MEKLIGLEVVYQKSSISPADSCRVITAAPVWDADRCEIVWGLLLVSSSKGEFIEAYPWQVTASDDPDADAEALTWYAEQERMELEEKKQEVKEEYEKRQAAMNNDNRNVGQS